MLRNSYVEPMASIDAEKVTAIPLPAVDRGRYGQHRAPHRRAFARVAGGLALCWFLFKLLASTQKELERGDPTLKQREDLFLYVPGLSCPIVSNSIPADLYPTLKVLLRHPVHTLPIPILLVPRKTLTTPKPFLNYSNPSLTSPYHRSNPYPLLVLPSLVMRPSD